MKSDFPPISILKQISLILLGSLGLGYSLWSERFAKLAIEPSFLNFPIFIGEIVLAVVFFLYVIDRFQHQRKLTVIDWCWIGYGVFVLFRAFWGYSVHGVLAFRHAALFYYALFALVTCWAFNGQFFRRPISAALIVLIIGLFLFYPIVREFALPLYFLCFILIRHYPDRNVRWLFYLLLLWITPFQIFFNSSRTILVGSILSLIVLSWMCLSLVRIPRQWKFCCVLLAIAGVMLLTFLKADRYNVRSLTEIQPLIERYVQTKENLKNFSVGAQDEMRTAVSRNFILYHKSESKIIDLSSLSKKKGINELNELNEIDKLTAELAQSTLGIEGGIEIAANGVSSFDQDSNLRVNNKIIIQRSEMDTPNTNTLFRIFIWEDMLKDLWKNRAIFGFHFGKPFISDILCCLYWGGSAWMYDGWVGAHNSFMECLYRTGIIGIFLIGFLFGLIGRMISVFLKFRFIDGLILSAISIYWLGTAFFSLILESPYTAIPIWIMLGISVHYYQFFKQQLNNRKT